MTEAAGPRWVRSQRGRGARGACPAFAADGDHTVCPGGFGQRQFCGCPCVVPVIYKKYTFGLCPLFLAQRPYNS